MKYRPDIDGLRAFAVVPVILYHASIPGFSGGFIGVDVFFVISGFLIARLISGEVIAGSFSLLNFYERRARRILPALAVVSFVSLVAAWVILLDDQLKQFGQSLFAMSTFTANLYFWKSTGYFAAPAEFAPLLHTWSLAVEEQFYLVFPVFVMLGYKLQRSLGIPFWLLVCVVLAVSALIGVTWTEQSPASAFYLLPARGWELLAGVLLALNRSVTDGNQPVREMVAFLGLGAILAGVLLIDEQTPFPGLAAAIPVLATVSLVWANTGYQTIVGKVLATRVIVLLGKLSYSLYLWHWPVIVFSKVYFGRSLTNAETVMAIGLSFALAVATWFWVEQPFRLKGIAASRRSMALFSVSSLALLMSCGIGLHLGDGFPGRQSEAAALLAKGARDITEGREQCIHQTPTQIASGDLCKLGPEENGETPFLLWGDSHGDSVIPAFRSLADKYDRPGQAAIFPGCPPLFDTKRVYGSNENCLAKNDAMRELVRSGRFADIILVARWSAYSGGLLGDKGGSANLIGWRSDTETDQKNSREVFESALLQTVSMLTKLGARVWIVEQAPTQIVNPPLYLARLEVLQEPIPDTMLLKTAEHESRQAFVHAVFLKASSAVSGVRLVDPAAVLCRSEHCLMRVGNYSLYRDNNHLNSTGAKYLEPILEQIFSTKH